MVAVRINGEDSTGVKSDGLTRFGDLIELIKSTIDPDHMITSILLNGRDLEESEWQMAPAQFGTAILEIETGTPESFVAERMSGASEIIGKCYMEFRDARKTFQANEPQTGNQKMIQAVNILKAFFQWYGTLLELVRPEKRGALNIDKQVSEISEVCKKICQQQLYQSWWALGETLEKELEPKLDALEDHLRRVTKAV